MSLALSSCHYVLRPRPGLGEPRSASNANKPASSWPLKQGRKKCSKHGCNRETSTVATDPIFGSKYGPQNGVQNWITFSFLLLSLCLGPVLGSRFGPKSGARHRKILLLPADVLQADLRRTSMSVSVNTCFSLCASQFASCTVAECLRLAVGPA